MEKLIEIREQSFYISTIEELVENGKKLNKCAVILFPSYIKNFTENAKEMFGKNINQIIIVNKDINELYAKLGGKLNLLIISAVSMQDATQVALNSLKYSDHIIYLNSDSSESTLSELLNSFKS